MADSDRYLEGTNRKGQATRVLIVAAIAALLVGLWFGWLGPVSVRWRQNNASVDMLLTQEAIVDYVHENGEWPRSWQDLFPEGMTSANRPRDVSLTVKVNWHASVGEIIDFVEQSDKSTLNDLPPEIDPPVLVEFTDQVPRNTDLIYSERRWNWTIATSVYRDHHDQEDK